MRPIASAILFIGLLAINSSCLKDKSLENGSTTTANGSLQRDINNDCKPIIIQGVCQVGIALGSGNTVTIEVLVTKEGSYSLNTSVVNGISFSGSGTAPTGNQTITLTGTGTPIAEGDINITVTFGSTTCTFPLTVIGSNGTDWKFAETANIHQGVTKGAQMNIVGSLNIFSYAGSSANEDIIITLTDISGDIQNNESYNTNSLSSNSAAFLFVGASETFKADNTTSRVNLVFTVTSHNTATKTIEGIFSGTVLDASSNIKTISNGQFKGTYL